MHPWRAGTVTFCVVVSCVLAGCDGGGDDDGESGAGVAGHWTGTGQYHTDDEGEPISMQFTMTLDLTQTGNAVQGSYLVSRQVRGDMPGAVSGTLNGDGIDMTLTPHGRAWGTVGDRTMDLTWFEDFGIGTGLTGTVTMQLQ